MQKRAGQQYRLEPALSWNMKYRFLNSIKTLFLNSLAKLEICKDFIYHCFCYNTFSTNLKLLGMELQPCAIKLNAKNGKVPKTLRAALPPSKDNHCLPNSQLS